MMSAAPDFAAFCRPLPFSGGAMAMPQDQVDPHQADHGDPDALWPMLLIGTAMVAMVAFSYWLNVW
jgi:hypothetical protein